MPHNIKNLSYEEQRKAYQKKIDNHSALKEAGCEIIAIERDKDSGYDGIAVRITKLNIIAVVSSGIDSLLDIKDVSAVISFDKSEKQLQYAKHLTEIAKTHLKHNESLEFVGHSYGGRLAQALSIIYNVKAISLNAPGSKEFIKRLFGEGANTEKIMLFITAKDPAASSSFLGAQVKPKQFILINKNGDYHENHKHTPEMYGGNEYAIIKYDSSSQKSWEQQFKEQKADLYQKQKDSLSAYKFYVSTQLATQRMIDSNWTAKRYKEISNRYNSTAVYKKSKS